MQERQLEARVLRCGRITVKGLGPQIEEPLVDENGVDLTLIRYSLSLTPTERLQSVESFMKLMSEVRVVRRARDELDPDTSK